MLVLLVALVGLAVLVSAFSRSEERVQPEASSLDAAGAPPRAVRVVRAVRARLRARSGPPPLPVGHRPPTGLGPLSPSERFLRSESARGIRELRLWMLDEDGAAA